MNRTIVIGFPGIGKSTLARNDLKYIDLESGAFWVDGKRPMKWWIPYVNTAINIAEQDHVVFISSHQQVRDYISSIPLPFGIKVVACYPALSLQSVWIDKLYARYKQTDLSKDYKAWQNIKTHYVSNIKSLMNFGVGKHVIIENINYDLKSLLEAN